MTGTAVSYNIIFNKIQKSLPASIENANTNLLKDVFDFKISESIKCCIEAAIRDYLLKNMTIGESADLKQVAIVVKICIEGARQDLCLPTLPVLVLSDAFDCITISQCEELFGFVEDNVSVWKEDLFFTTCKTQVLRMCNDVLRKLSRSQNTIFCGRILLFLARFFPFSERSGLNLISEFNLENVTTFTDSESMDVDVDIKTSEDSKQRPSLDYTLYTKFWALQDFFRNPTQCFQKAPWRLFTKYADDIFVAFSSFKLDNVQGKKLKSRHSQMANTKEAGDKSSKELSSQYFPKYLTNQKLLDLQFADSNFRRYVLLQMLILTQYLTSNIKFKQDVLTEEQQEWVKHIQSKTYSLMAETPPNGQFFVDIVKQVFKREVMWSEWKNNGCPETRKPGSNVKHAIDEKDEDVKMPPAKRAKRPVGDQIRDAQSKNKFAMGNAEMTRLWNFCPDNLESCKLKNRDFAPSLEIYFKAAIQQHVDKMDIKSPGNLVNQSSFGWRALRLLAGKSPHFFTNSANTIATLTEYLTTMIGKLYKDIQAQKSEEAKAEEVDEEEKVVLDQSDAVKVDEEEQEQEEDEDETEREEVTPLNKEQLNILGTNLDKEGSESWITFGTKIGFTTDEMEYFESEGKTRLAGISMMLERWVENEKDEANKSYLLYTLEGLKMTDVAKGVF